MAEGLSIKQTSLAITPECMTSPPLKTPAAGFGLNIGERLTVTPPNEQKKSLLGSGIDTSALTTPTSIGLGGTTGLPNAETFNKDSVLHHNVKELPVPMDFIHATNDFLQHMQKQKATLDEMRCKPVAELANEPAKLLRLQQNLQKLRDLIASDAKEVQHILAEIKETMQAAENSQCTQYSSGGFILENTVSLKLLHDLVTKNEQSLKNFVQQVELTERRMKSFVNQSFLTPENLKRCLQQLDDALASLSGRACELHQRIEVQKKRYLNLHGHRLDWSTNVHKSAYPKQSTKTSCITPGPSPFINISGICSVYKSITK